MTQDQKESLVKFYKTWCKQTGRSGGILLGRSVREFLVALESFIEQEVELPAKLEGFEAARQRRREDNQFEYADKQDYENSITKTP